MAEVSNIAFFDLAVLAEGFAEVDGFVGFAVGGGPAGAGDMHLYNIKAKYLNFKNKTRKLPNYACLHIWSQKSN
jgi:hypothetical protein